MRKYLSSILALVFLFMLGAPLSTTAQSRLPRVPVLKSQTDNGGLQTTDHRHGTIFTQSPFMLQHFNGQKTGFQRAKSYIAPKEAITRKAIAKTEDGSTIYGNVLYSDLFTSASQIGIYSFPADLSSGLTAVNLNPDINAVGGGVTFNKKFAFVTYETNDDGNAITSVKYDEYDTDSWQLIREEDLGTDVRYIGCDAAYDPTTGRIYGCFYNSNLTGFNFAYYNPDNMEYHVVSTQTFRDASTRLVSIAINSEGEVYGMGVDGIFYKINKETGEKTAITTTAITTSRFAQSAAFDESDGGFYWVDVVSDGWSVQSTLYELDPATGDILLQVGMPSNEEVVGLYIPYQEASDEAPAEVLNLSANFDGGSTTGTLTFTMPTTTVGGGDLSEATYTVTVGDSVIATATASAGAEVSVPVSAKTGMATFAVTLSNAAGNGPVKRTTLWVGNDTPVAVSNVRLVVNKETGESKLTWASPKKGIHDGYVNPSAVTYDITRLPDSVQVANGLADTVFTENLGEKAPDRYYYKITPIFDGQAGPTVSSTAVLYGQAYNIPYGEGFDLEDDLNDYYTIVDANNDSNTWKFFENMWKGWDQNFNMIPSGAAEYVYASDSSAADDWLVSPLLNLKSDRDYNFYLRSAGSDNDHLHDFEKSNDVKVFIGLGDDPTKYTTQVNFTGGPETENDFYSSYNSLFSIPSDGQYRFAVHSTGITTGQFFESFMIDSIGITQNSLFGAPAKIDNFKVEAGAKGDYSATVSFNAPSKTYHGDALEAISKIDVIKDGKVVKTFDNPTPGEALSYTDNDVDNGMVAYTAYAENSIGKSLTVTDSVFVGDDVPVAPENAKTTDNGDHLTVSWDPVTKGVHDGYVDNDAVTYTVVNSDGKTITRGKKTTTVDDTPDGLTGKQHLQQYGITALGNGGQSTQTVTYPTVLGDAYNLPFHESFAGGHEQHEGWWTTCNVDFYGWEPTKQGSADEDNGSAYLVAYNYYNTPEGVIGWLNTGKISLKGTTNPGLIFTCAGYSNDGNTPSGLKVLVDNGGQSIDTVAAYSFGVYSSDSSAWHRAIIPLTKYIDSPYIIVRFGGQITDRYQGVVVLDDVNIHEMLKDNLQAQITTDSVALLGREQTATVTVDNIGIDDAAADSYTIRLYVDGKEASSQSGTALKANTRKKFYLTYTPSVNAGDDVEVKAVVEYAPDLDTDDNTASVIIPSKVPAFPTVSGLNGSINGSNASLAWTAPDLSSLKPTTDGFEDYTPWTNQFGEWKTIDGDEGYTSMDNRMPTPVATQPNSYIVYNPSLIDENYADNAPEYTPHAGNQFLASFSADEAFNLGNVQNDDDWLISPELSGRAQTISFWAKAMGSESFEVLGSRTDNSQESFTDTITTSEETPSEDWQQYSYELPEGIKYFAVHHNTSIWGYEWALFLDDVTYEGVYDYLELTGYNIYRNGEYLANVKDVTTFTDANAKATDTYQVSAVYTAGESQPCDPIAIDPTGINSVKGGLHIGVAPETIIISGANGEQAEVYAADGSLISQRSGADNYTIGVKGGVYLVKIGKQAVKLIVK